jgi:hypothetical protein
LARATQALEAEDPVSGAHLTAYGPLEYEKNEDICQQSESVEFEGPNGGDENAGDSDSRTTAGDHGFSNLDRTVPTEHWSAKRVHCTTLAEFEKAVDAGCHICTQIATSNPNRLHQHWLIYTDFNFRYVVENGAARLKYLNLSFL